MKRTLFLSMLIAGAMVSTQSQAMLPVMARRLGVVAVPTTVIAASVLQKRAYCQAEDDKLTPEEQAKLQELLAKAKKSNEISFSINKDTIYSALKTGAIAVGGAFVGAVLILDKMFGQL